MLNRTLLRKAENKGQKAFRFRENFPDLVLLDRPDFNGPAYERKVDRARLAGQILRVHAVMSDGYWWTLEEIRATIFAKYDVVDPPASISAQLRHLRKERFGGHHIEKRRRREGLWEYRLEKCT